MNDDLINLAAIAVLEEAKNLAVGRKKFYVYEDAFESLNEIQFT
jgi:hypothetical protein